MIEPADVVVVGAGLSGLAAARRLGEAGLDAVVLDAADAVGGRIRTDVVDGFRLDRGFAVVDTGYPMLRKLVDLDALQLGRFTRGAIVRRGTLQHRYADPLLHPTRALATLGAPGTLVDKLQLGLRAARDAVAPAGARHDADDTTTADEFARWGLSDRIVDEFLRPFLAGVFLERDLTTSARWLHLLLRSMTRGWQALPAEGMQALPEQLARDLPARLHLHTRVTQVRHNGVTLADGPEVRARAVVVATDPDAVPDLLPSLPTPVMHGVTTLYHSCAAPPLDEPTIVLDLDRPDLVANTLVVTAGQPAYAPAGRALVQTSIVGIAPDDVEPAVRRRLAEVYGTDTGEWDHLATYVVPAALPAFPAGTPVQQRVRLRPGLYVCGDHRETPSQDGALSSGLRAAEAALVDLHMGPGHDGPTSPGDANGQVTSDG